MTRVGHAVSVIGAGLAGCEAAWQLISRGIAVNLYEMKPAKRSPAHYRDGFAELVCSNSLKSDMVTNACGLLKEEMRRIGSLTMDAAKVAKVPAGSALAVDRDVFSDYITRALKEHPLCSVIHEEVTEIPALPAIIATGPLTADGFTASIERLRGAGSLRFFDAACPIISADSIDFTFAYRASRYGQGDDYINCPMNREEYFAFHNALSAAQVAPVEAFEAKQVFEGCLAVEILAGRGEMTLAYGPLKPIGLKDPRTGRTPFAVVQLRQDDAAGTLYNMVGFQTRLKHGEQRRVFRMIPGLANAEFARYGVMHRNTYLLSPGFLKANYAVIDRPGLYFAGQITGVEGYVESASSGLLAGLSLAQEINGQAPLDFTGRTVIGALSRYVTVPQKDFQPMNANFGIVEPMDERIRNKRARYEAIAERSLHIINEVLNHD